MVRRLNLFVTLMSLYLCFFLGKVNACDSDLTFEQIVNAAGFLFESHQVESQGYLLTLYRIPGLKSTDSDQLIKKSPVLFQHGMFDSALAWIINHADQSPAFLASNAGYDVWLANARGSTPSRYHLTLDPDDRNQKTEFWDFDWEDMARDDLPAVFIYISNVTKFEKIAYIGHQEGTTQMFYALETNSEFFAKHLSVFVALSPATKLTNTQSDLIKFAT